MIKEQEKGMRKHYMDNLRNVTILLLFPVHTFMIWNDFGSRFYIWQGENKLLSALIVLVNPWFMPICGTEGSQIAASIYQWNNTSCAIPNLVRKKIF